jgi:hypothetical protein
MLVLAVAGPLIPACGETDPPIRFFRSGEHTFSQRERVVIEQITRSAFREVRPLLPALPARIEVTVRPGSDVIVETGETADAMPPAAIMWTVDPKLHGGVEAIARKWLRATLFHELHHLARSAVVAPRTLVDRAVFEGMASVFERDFAGAQPPWTAYPSNVSSWADELKALPPDAPVRDWIYAHPDGRRWIGMKVGSFWVDRAKTKSGRSAADLVALSTDEVIALAER